MSLRLQFWWKDSSGGDVTFSGTCAIIIRCNNDRCDTLLQFCCTAFTVQSLFFQIRALRSPILKAEKHAFIRTRCKVCSKLEIPSYDASINQQSALCCAFQTSCHNDGKIPLMLLSLYIFIHIYTDSVS